MIDMEKLRIELKRLNAVYYSGLLDDIEIAIEDNSQFVYVTDGYEDKELYIKDILSE